jgi:hypothetical protein
MITSVSLNVAGEAVNVAVIYNDCIYSLLKNLRVIVRGDADYGSERLKLRKVIFIRVAKLITLVMFGATYV